MTLISIVVASASAQTYEASPLHAGAEPDVYGDASFTSNVLAALNYLKESYPQSYASVTYWLSEIRPTETYTRVNNYGICHINARDSGASYAWLAGVLIHEARHVEDDGTYFLENAYSDRESESRALGLQAAYLAAANGWTPAQADQWIGYWLEKKYWETTPKNFG